MAGLITLVSFALIFVAVSGEEGDWLALFTKDPTTERISHPVFNTTFCNVQVKGCGSVSITFESNKSWSFLSLYIFKIVIGGYGKKKKRKTGVAFYSRGSKFPWAEAYGDFLSCTEFRNFWISWTNGHLKLGTGLNEETGNVVLRSMLDVPFFNYIRVDSLFGGKAEWKLNCHSSDASHFLMEAIAPWPPRDRLTMVLQNEYDYVIMDLNSNISYHRLLNVFGETIDRAYGKLLSSKKYRPLKVTWSATMIKLEWRTLRRSWLNWLGTMVQRTGQRLRLYNDKRIYTEHSKGGPNNIPAVRCPIGYWYHPEFKSCYKFVCGITFSHEQAKTQCARFGGYLAIANSEKENNFFKYTLKADNENGDFFLGGQRSQPNGGWVWTGHPSGLNQPFAYSDWNSGQPDNSGSCIAVSVAGWNDVDCNGSYEFICEANPKVY
ncbi:unnamed protein product [Owenia fusiformis]|uniref:C-type lectin domain-containing protein n=1 Tax=Owenia fusiformis TaxID=6347 RepID=A0A8S4PCP0_OWEFU|nr:unnamed protein product [Owenia fusiformis]